jgi:outer membrane lipoprotein-sorting protein
MEVCMRPRPYAILLAVLTLPVPAVALTGREVIDQAQQKHGLSTWRDRTQSASMQSYEGDTVARERTFAVAEQTDPHGDHKTFVRFTGPTDVRGATFLHLSPRGERDQQWLWTPATRRVRRLAEAQQDENFFGSDLSYRDLELIVRIQQWTDADSTATLLREEPIDGKPCHVVELLPGNDEFSYSRYRLWFDTSDLLLWRVDVYDANDRETVRKRVTLRGYERVEGFATALEADVRNVSADTHTRMQLHDVHYDRGVPDDTFTLANLSRGQ